MGEHYPVREKSGNFDRMGEVREFYPKYWKDVENDLMNKLKKNGNVYLGYMSKNTFSLTSLGIPVLISTNLRFIVINNR